DRGNAKHDGGQYPQRRWGGLDRARGGERQRRQRCRRSRVGHGLESAPIARWRRDRSPRELIAIRGDRKQIAPHSLDVGVAIGWVELGGTGYQPRERGRYRRRNAG